MGDGCVIDRSESRELREVRAASGCRLCGRGRLNALEATIARMLVEGMDERRVAAELFIGAVALRAHLARICAKLDIPSPADLVLVIGRGTALDFNPGRADGVGGCRERKSVDRTQLTQQEAAVLRLMRQGLDARQVAAELFIGIGAVGSNLANIHDEARRRERPAPLTLRGGRGRLPPLPAPTTARRHDQRRRLSRSGEDAGEGVVEFAGVVEDALGQLVHRPVDGREVRLDAVAQAGEDLVAIARRDRRSRSSCRG